MFSIIHTVVTFSYAGVAQNHEDNKLARHISVVKTEFL